MIVILSDNEIFNFTVKFPFSKDMVISRAN